jgi:hypothetical protein
LVKRRRTSVSNASSIVRVLLFVCFVVIRLRLPFWSPKQRSDLRFRCFPALATAPFHRRIRF